MQELGQQAVMDMSTGSNLRGRGGAGFPTGRKWSFLPNNGRPRYLVCNCDEAEPGTFKDHMLLEADAAPDHRGHPDRRVRASAAITRSSIFAASFRSGYEIFRAARRRRRAPPATSAKASCGSDYDLEFTIHRGAGAYICGEETGLLNSLEGKRGEPRLKPPFPAIKGLYGEPTVVNNVETLAYLPYILRNGPEWFAKVGPERSPGYKIVSISGHVKKPGNYEVPLGTTMRELIDDCAGGLARRPDVSRRCSPAAVRRRVSSKSISICRTISTAIAKAGSMLGSGAIVVFDDTTDFVKAAYTLVRFYAHESCGQCTPCREGGSWMQKRSSACCDGRGVESDIDDARIGLRTRSPA